MSNSTTTTASQVSTAKENFPYVVGQPKIRTADAKMAEKAFSEFRVISIKKGQKDFGWKDIRQGKIDAWLKKDGLLGEAGWNDDKTTRDYLQNLQLRARELGQQAAEKIRLDLGLSNEEAATQSFDQIVEAAKKKGWKVTPGNPEGDKMLDFLKNGHDFTVESVAAMAGATERELADAGIKYPDAARLMLELMGKKNLAQVLETRAQKILQAGVRIEKGQVKITEANKVALALDLQIAGIKHNINAVQTMMEGIDKDKDQAKLGELQKQRNELADKMLNLIKQRESGKLDLEIGGKHYSVDSNDVKAEPNQLANFILKLGGKKEEVERNPLQALAGVIPNLRSDPEAIDAFMQKVTAAGDLNKNQIDKLNYYLTKGPDKTPAQVAKDVLRYGGGGLSLLVILALFMNIMEKKGPG